MDKREMLRIAIVGKGNVGYHLAKALEPKCEVTLFDSRKTSSMKGEYDVIIIAVSDRAIEEVAKSIPSTGAVVAHTSGSVPMSVLEQYHKRVGVFYPLMTFSKDRKLEYCTIPIFTEGCSIETVEVLNELAKSFSKHVHSADSEKRRHLHLASVFACNFVNFLYSRAWGLLENVDVPTSSLYPLIMETAAKTLVMNPTEGQTGPAVRGDLNVINKHLKMLEDVKVDYSIYQLFSAAIKESRNLTQE